MKKTPISSLFGPNDRKTIEAAIAAAESQTNGEIRVVMTQNSGKTGLFVSGKKKYSNVLKKAKGYFDRTEMHNTKDRSGILIFLSIDEHIALVVGDERIGKHCGDDSMWVDMKNVIVDGMKHDKGVDGICRAVKMAGGILSNFFPKTDDDVNELPNQVEIIA